MSRSFGRKNTPKGQMSSGGGPAIMMMQPAIRATFMPNPPLKFLPPPSETRKKSTKIQNLTGVANFMSNFATGPAPPRPERETRETMIQRRAEAKKKQHDEKLEPQITTYREEVDKSQGEFEGMNCYNTIFVGRLAYEVTDRKLLREFESYGPVKDLKLICDTITGKSKGYAFIEYENEEDMRRAYRAADGMRIEGREIVVDVERGHTVPKWLPRKLGGGLGGTRLGGKMENVRIPGRWDPKQQQQQAQMMQQAPMMMRDDPYYNNAGPPPPPHYHHHHHHSAVDDYHHGGGGGYDSRRGGGGGSSSYRNGGYDSSRGGPPSYSSSRYGGYNDSNRGGAPPRGAGGYGGDYNNRGPGGGSSSSRGLPPPPPRRPYYDHNNPNAAGGAGSSSSSSSQQWGSRGGYNNGNHHHHHHNVGDKRRRSRSGSPAAARDRSRRW